MKIYIICSKSFYDELKVIKEFLINKGYEVIMPNTYNKPNIVDETLKKGDLEYSKLIKKLFQLSEDTIKEVDAVLCINNRKNNIDNYIGGATFIELYEAFKNNKKIYLYHDIPNNILYDEILGMNPIVINEDLGMI